MEVIGALRSARLRTLLPKDARVFQILFLGALLAIGVLARDFTVRWEQMALAFAAGLATQAFALRRLRIANGSYLSAVITCFGLSILLRADTLWVHPLAAMIAIGSKFVLRVNGKHIYNPANLGVMASLLLLPGTWISPGQWGQDLAAAAWFVMLGSVVTGRARRWDVSWTFLACFLGMVLARVLLLGQNLAVFAHQLGNGGLLLFAFFMISDPMTIPNHRHARLLYALIVAALAIWWQYGLFKPNAPVWALFLCTPLVPLLDRVWLAERFQWQATPMRTG
ncbi:MAG: RnfABCDGE type electron transport complex subunit D [Betaproteobacteria bacterium]